MPERLIGKKLDFKTPDEVRLLSRALDGGGGSNENQPFLLLNKSQPDFCSKKFSFNFEFCQRRALSLNHQMPERLSGKSWTLLCLRYNLKGRGNPNPNSKFQGEWIL
jgi:hypothetical protein